MESMKVEIKLHESAKSRPNIFLRVISSFYFMFSEAEMSFFVQKFNLPGPRPRNLQFSPIAYDLQLKCAVGISAGIRIFP